MLRALLILVAGMLLAVLLGAVIAGDRDLLAVLGPVLVTTAVGTAVLAVVAWRARIRERAQQLEDKHLHETRDQMRATPRDQMRATPRDQMRATPRDASTPRPAERVTDEHIEDTDRG